MKQKIEVTKEVRERLAKSFKITPQAIGQALHFKTNSVKSLKIRAMAIECGGILYEEKSNSHQTKVLDSHGNVKQVI